MKTKALRWYAGLDETLRTEVRVKVLALAQEPTEAQVAEAVTLAARPGGLARLGVTPALLPKVEAALQELALTLDPVSRVEQRTGKLHRRYRLFLEDALRSPRAWLLTGLAWRPGTFRLEFLAPQQADCPGAPPGYRVLAGLMEEDDPVGAVVAIDPKKPDAPVLLAQPSGAPEVVAKNLSAFLSRLG